MSKITLAVALLSLVLGLFNFFVTQNYAATVSIHDKVLTYVICEVRLSGVFDLSNCPQ